MDGDLAEEEEDVRTCAFAVSKRSLSSPKTPDVEAAAAEDAVLVYEELEPADLYVYSRSGD